MNLTRSMKIAILAAVVLVLIGVLLSMSGGATQAVTPLTAANVPTRLLTQPIADDAPDARKVRLGQYLVRVGDCTSCHTRDGGRFMSGGFGLNTPFGTIYSTNLTSDPETGIGGWTADRFYAALHDGSGRHGALYPAMPYPYTTRATRADSDAILAFLKTVPAVKENPPPNGLSFPFNIRFLVHGWNLLFFSRGEFKPDPAKSSQYNRGAYLVTGLGHCGACHTPKNSLAGDRASLALQGGTIDNWVAPDLTSNMRTGLGRWSADDVVEYLQTGRNAHANAGGAMAKVVSFSTSLLSETDLRAIAAYLKDQPASADAKPGDADPGAMKRGAEIYSDACTACHMEKGLGQPRLFPPLPGNAMLQQADPTGLIHIILAGDRTAATLRRPSPLTMPSFAWKLDDRQIADVATYIRNSWGNHAQPVAQKQVQALRKTLGLVTVHLTDGSGDRN